MRSGTLGRPPPRAASYLRQWWAARQPQDDNDEHTRSLVYYILMYPPLFILYTSGSTGKPKGILHTTAGYLLGAHLSFKYLFGYHNEDRYWCTADVGWITGHTYILYGPLSNGATSLMFEGIPTYPSPSRFWEICDKHKISIFYTDFNKSVLNQTWKITGFYGILPITTCNRKKR